MHEESSRLDIHVKSVQQQNSGADCGVFAIAFSVSLLMGEDPETVSYDENALRRHLLDCLRTKNFTKFPKYSTHGETAMPSRNNYL